MLFFSPEAVNLLKTKKRVPERSQKRAKTKPHQSQNEPTPNACVGQSPDGQETDEAMARRLVSCGFRCKLGYDSEAE